MKKQGDKIHFSEHLELYNLETEKEIRHLKSTITVLRQELDTLHMNSEQRIAEAVREASKEIAQLKTVARSLR